LEAVGNKPALILEEDNKLVIRSYDSKNGRLLGEIAVNHTVPQKEIDTAYEAFTDEISHQLNIAMISGSNKNNDVVEKTVWSFCPMA
jgi:LytB protein.